MNQDDQKIMQDLIFRKAHVERAKTEAMVCSLRLCAALAVCFFLWLPYSPFSDEARFYTEACKLGRAEMPVVLHPTCAAIKNQIWRKVIWLPVPNPMQ